MSDVTIEWFGHSYVRVTSPGNTRIVIDPHDGGSLNLPEFRVEADYVLVTHNHYDHNAVEMVRGSPIILRQFRGEKRLGDAILRGLKTYHDKAEGRLRGENTVYILIINNIKIVHMGDLGHVPDGDILQLLANADILMIPVGGVYTIDAYEAWDIADKINAKVILPIHFWTPRSTVPLDSLERFLNIAKAGRTRLDNNIIQISKESLSKIKRTIIVMPEPYIIARKLNNE